MAPYRSIERPAPRVPDGEHRAMRAAGALLVAASLARVAGALIRGETFGTDATCAFLALLVITVAAVRRLALARSPGGAS
jgi:hypothetical protein